MEINGNPPLKVVEQSTKLQVQRHNKGTTSKRSKKRKTFAKKKKRKRTKQQKNETLLSPPLSEDFILKDEESNYTAENNRKQFLFHLYISKAIISGENLINLRLLFVSFYFNE